MPDPFDAAEANAALRGTVFAGKLQHFPVLDSTQSRAIAEAQRGAESGQVYVTDRQTAGRGRGGHAWHSENDGGLYLSVLVRPALEADAVLRLSLATALAAQAAIVETHAARIDLRWPNDLVTAEPNSRKLGGILTETAMQPDGRLRYAVIGVGINVNQAAMPTDLEGISTSLRLQTGRSVPRAAVAIALLRALHDELATLQPDIARLLERFAAGSTWVHGKPVHVAEDEGYTGVTDGLTGNGLLRIRCADGTVRIVRHGGVRALAG